MVARLARGERVAYVSDAGTPGVSATRARRWWPRCAAAGHRVLPLPGASSVTTLSARPGDRGGDAAGAFVFAGFLPQQGRRARARAAALAARAARVVLLEAPHRIEALAAALAAAAARGASPWAAS